MTLQNVINQLKSDYRAGRIGKADYIKAMYVEHAALFHYAELLSDTNIRTIEILDDELVMTVRDSGVRMVCAPGDERIAPIEILNFGDYEPQEAAIARELLDPSSCVFDIGANFGWYSLNLAAQVDGLRVHAFEPVPDTYAYLQRNCALNPAIPIHTYPFGFSDTAGFKEFYFYPEGSGNASLANLSARSSVREITCELRRLDDFVDGFGARVDFVKCDVEGAELLVFQGGARTLAEHQPIIFTEMLRKWSSKFDYHPNEIITLLADLGYRCFTVEGLHLRSFTEMNRDTIETNFFFLHTERHAHKIAKHAQPCPGL